jgi:hypothetical protein
MGAQNSWAKEMEGQQLLTAGHKNSTFDSRVGTSDGSTWNTTWKVREDMGMGPRGSRRQAQYQCLPYF